ncbi:hypothetical protein Aph01nite_18300 [Acrocarpospora phusangensis]|uniref:Uncharacterized protein n=1 Tax=Acrocarpospora phusangensis TaxID=1070424 RepID=A0A919QA24_9ACTN|nr:hypothetical protein Aph01nite_18300 [Acrocarpospora phusangensis]
MMSLVAAVAMERTSAPSAIRYARSTRTGSPDPVSVNAAITVWLFGARTAAVNLIGLVMARISAPVPA